ncbi:hypothetical protein HMPREF1553_02376 [Porphyromonas gingivalis F0568]|nr:hypothetical protein HMPREF1553_02376 [Porphyromonas gingivalis F0568]
MQTANKGLTAKGQKACFGSCPFETGRIGGTTIRPFRSCYI